MQMWTIHHRAFLSPQHGLTIYSIFKPGIALAENENKKISNSAHGSGLNETGFFCFKTPRPIKQCRCGPSATKLFLWLYILNINPTSNQNNVHYKKSCTMWLTPESNGLLLRHPNMFLQGMQMWTIHHRAFLILLPSLSLTQFSHQNLHKNALVYNGSGLNRTGFFCFILAYYFPSNEDVDHPPPSLSHPPSFPHLIPIFSPKFALKKSNCRNGNGSGPN
jgi:hypothetical protein